jgi:hypothetical protein
MNNYGLTDEQMKPWNDMAADSGKTGEDLLEYYMARQREFFKDGVEAAVQRILENDRQMRERPRGNS